MRVRSSFSVLLLVLVASATNAEAKRGLELYVRYCAACHGENADGDGPVANVMTPRPPALVKLRGKFGRPLGTRFVAYVMGDLMPSAHGTTDMPVWGQVLATPEGDDGEALGQIWRIAAYLDSIQTR